MQLAWAVFAAQAGLGVIAAGAWWLCQDETSAMAALFGAGVAVIPGLFFALRLLRQARGATPKQIAWALYLGEIGKLALTIGLFVAAALMFGDAFVPLITTYAACLLCYWLALVVNR